MSDMSVPTSPAVLVARASSTSIGMDVGGSGAQGTAEVLGSTAIELGVGEVAPGTGAADSWATSLTGCVDVEELGSPTEDMVGGSSMEAMRVFQSLLVWARFCAVWAV